MEAINFNKQKRDQGVEDVKFIVNLIYEQDQYPKNKGSKRKRNAKAVIPVFDNKSAHIESNYRPCGGYDATLSLRDMRNTASTLPSTTEDESTKKDDSKKNKDLPLLNKIDGYGSYKVLLKFTSSVTSNKNDDLMHPLAINNGNKPQLA